MVELISNPELKAEDLKVAGLLFHKKLQAGYFYKPEGVYNGDIVLVKAKDNFVPLENDYGLGEVSE